MKRVNRIKLPSTKYIIARSKESFLRFPLTILSSLVATFIGIYLVEFSHEINNYFPLISLLLTSILGISSFFCCALFVEKNHLNLKSKLICTLGVIVLLAIVYFSLPGSKEAFTSLVSYIRFGVLAIIAHLCVCFIPYVGDKNINGFWNYNKMLFLRFFTASLYSGVLFLGLLLAVEALILLFEVNVDKQKLYPKFFIFAAGLFSTWSFVTGIPKELNKLDPTQGSPYAIKVFAQYVLLPLLALYLIIIYAYATKILFLWDWPKGIVAYLISGISMLGIITFLLTYPYGRSKENSWIKLFANSYFYILFPLIILLFIAIWLRISAYGTTINRYVIVALGIWLSIISFYFSLRKTNIKFIPISLAIILFLMLFGPWSMFWISEKSQVSRLKKILTDHSILIEGSLKNEVIWEVKSLPEFYSKNENNNEQLFNDSIENEIKSILDYLNDYHGMSKIQSFTRQNLDSLALLSSKGNKDKNLAEIYMRTFGLKYENKVLSEPNYLNYFSEPSRVILIKNYDFFLEFNSKFEKYMDYQNTPIDSFKIDRTDYTLSLSTSQNNSGLTLAYNGQIILFKLDSLIGELYNEFGNNYQKDIAKHKMTLEKSSSTFDNIRIEIRSLGLNRVNDTTMTPNYISGRLFLKEKE